MRPSDERFPRSNDSSAAACWPVKVGLGAADEPHLRVLHRVQPRQHASRAIADCRGYRHQDAKSLIQHVSRQLLQTTQHDAEVRIRSKQCRQLVVWMCYMPLATLSGARVCPRTFRPARPTVACTPFELACFLVAQLGAASTMLFCWYASRFTEACFALRLPGRSVSEIK
jgi:hypothetical protein